ncbi:hypothetical protein B0A48_09778 [Cryoendolithus antarcticus]|uniref:Major facilitator superfamily (MFS) profile domain-containing protein n=1 Tax=Cryoendolithus antarcticus TaxID=1507870 RepID=A0A1V8T2P1_9PEZI|nr:hypothetical protein B0A48_09778 [Cryoendolithus antarcticus]
MGSSIFERLKPAGYTAASIILSAGSLLNGFDTGSIGAVTVMPQFVEVMGPQPPTIIGLTISIILFGGAFSSPFAGQLANRYGHPRVIAAGAAAFASGSILQASALSLGQFIAGRLVAGLAEGIYLGLLNVYVCEIAPSKNRGTLASLLQLATAVGLPCGYFTCYGTVRISGSLAWRAPFIMSTVIAALLTGSCFYIPLSPRWLMANGRRDDAARFIAKLGIQAAEAEKDILSFRDEDVQKQLGFLRSIALIFSKPYRARTTLAFFILGMVQLCGIDGVLFYAPLLFAQAGLSKSSASFLASGLSAILIVLISIPAMFLADRIGRRASVLTGGVLLTTTMLIVGTLYAAEVVTPEGAARWVVIVSIFLFALSYSATWAMVGKIYASEIQPGSTRGVTNSVAQGLNFLTNAFVALITPILLDHSAYGAYFLFAGLSLFTTIVLGLYMPETKGQPLETIQEVFSKPLQVHGARFIQRVEMRHREHIGVELSVLG